MKNNKSTRWKQNSTAIQNSDHSDLSVCLSVCLHTFISFACESKSCWKVYNYSKSSKRGESPFFCCNLTQRFRLWKCTMQRVNGMGRIAAAANSSYPLQQLRKAGPGRHQNTPPVPATPLVLLNSPFFAKFACLKIASALDYQTRTTTQKVGGMELENWSWVGRGEKGMRTHF